MARLPQNGFVYFMKPKGLKEGLGITKIGWAIDPRKRLREIQTGSPYPLELIGAFPGTRADERWAHDQLARFRRRGEWFSLYGTTDVIDVLAQRGGASLSEVVAAVTADFAVEQDELRHIGPLLVGA